VSKRVLPPSNANNVINRLEKQKEERMDSVATLSNLYPSTCLTCCPTRQHSYPDQSGMQIPTRKSLQNTSGWGLFR